MFERYEKDTRRALFYAHAEALHEHAAAITPVHLLLGLTWDNHLPSRAVWPVKDSAEALRASSGMVDRPDMSAVKVRQLQLKFDSDAKKALAYAAREAEEDRLKVIGVDHLLRGILRFKNAATPALDSIGLNLADARERTRNCIAKD